ncbi:MAG: hypothetical protein QXY62_05535 [Candidatus Altiarchaeota archaeon]
MKIQIITPSRLHFGFFNFYEFTSAGVAIEKPNFFIEVEKSKKLKVEGFARERARRYAKIFLKKFNLSEMVKIQVKEEIPEHVGLGSGTQLALGIGTAISELFGLNLSTEEIANIAKRGKISKVGTLAFKYGGFVIDDEKIFNCKLPDSWIWLITIPKNQRGLSGKKEDVAFKKLPCISEKYREKLRMVKEKMINSLIEKDIFSFGKAINELDIENGKVFSKFQNGVYISKDVENGIKILLENGAFTAGQSSWGPGFYGLVDKKKKAIEIQKKLRSFFCEEADIFITKTNNKGAKIRWLEH